MYHTETCTGLTITSDWLEILSSEMTGVFSSSLTKIFSLSLTEEVEEHGTEQRRLHLLLILCHLLHFQFYLHNVYRLIRRFL